MGRPVLDDDEPLELPRALGEDDEATGLADADEVMLADIDEAPEDVGLDVEPFGVDDLEALDTLEEPSESDLDDGGLEEVIAEVDAEGDENGWVEDSEGSSGAWDDESFVDEDEDQHDDGGLEGVDDPMLDGLSDEDEPSASDEDDDGPEADVGDDLLREIAQEG